MFQTQKQSCFQRFIYNDSLQTNLKEPKKSKKSKQSLHRPITDPEVSRRFKRPDFQTIGA